MENPSCPNHGPMTWKTGTSKTTGKAYAFWSCPTKLPDGSWCPTKGPKNAAPATAGIPALGSPSLGNGISFGQGERIIQLLEKLAGEN